jgi:hypothetical protein
MTEPNLHHANRIVLIRCPNGWMANNDSESTLFVFESTESLQNQLVRLLGKSGWQMTMPERDEKGHFKPNNP